MVERGEHQRGMSEVLSKAVDMAAAGTVFGEPVSRDDITVIPVARVRGKGGGGGGGGDGQRGGGGGAKFAVSAKPVGVFVIRGGKVAWRPSLDINKIIMGGQLVGVAALLTIRSLRARSCSNRPR